MTAKVTVHYEDFQLTDGIYPQPDGILSLNTTAAGQWARWNAEQPVLLDETGAACINLVLSGELAISWNGTFMFHTTEAGRTRVDTAIRRGGFDRGLDA